MEIASCETHMKGRHTVFIIRSWGRRTEIAQCYLSSRWAILAAYLHEHHYYTHARMKSGVSTLFNLISV